MRRPLLLAVVAALAACVEVPDTIRTQFAAPEPGERSNYRPGAHGTAPPVDDGDAAPASAAHPTSDGGVT
jgi:hypothetical protein